MYSLKNLVVVAGNSESGDGTIDILDNGALEGLELVLYNGTGDTMTVQIGNVAITIPNNGILDEAFKPFTSFTVTGTGAGDWSWYVRG